MLDLRSGISWSVGITATGPSLKKALVELKTAKGKTRSNSRELTLPEIDEIANAVLRTDTRLL